MQVETGKSNLPAYVPFQTFLNFLTKLEQGVPHRIDRSFLNRSYSGAMGSQLITSLRFLGLVEGEDNRTTAELERLVHEQSARKQLLGQLLQERYQPTSELPAILAQIGQLPGQSLRRQKCGKMEHALLSSEEQRRKRRT